VKSLTFGLKRSDKKAKSFELFAKASVKMLEADSLSKVEEGEIERINKEEEEPKRLEKEEDNKFPCCFNSSNKNFNSSNGNYSNVIWK
jgi:hypothetical protein